MTTTATSAATTTSATSATSPKLVSKLLDHVLEIIGTVGILFVFLLLFFFVKDSAEEGWSTIWFFDLKHSVWVLKTFLTILTVVKVLEDTTFVAESNNWAHSTAITGDAGMDNLILSKLSITLILFIIKTVKIL